MKKKTEEEFINQCITLHNNRYFYTNVKYVNSHIKVLITCSKHGDFLQTPHNHLKGQGCFKCKVVEKFDNLRLTNYQIDKFLLDKNILIKRIDNHYNTSTPIKWQCLKCNNEWKARSNSIRRDVGCPKCNDTKLTNKYIDDFLKNKAIRRIDNHINCHFKINWECLKCKNIWSAKPGEILRKGINREGSGCPNCARGKNEKRVSEVLCNLNFKIEKIKIVLNNKKLFPDFYLPEINTIIEYNGIQHYQPTCFGSMSKVESEIIFKGQQKRDDSLRKYCNDSNISLVEIDGRKYKGDKLKDFVFNLFNNRVKL